MRPGQQQNKQRMRGRGRKGPNPLSRSYESNGPDVKIRGTAQHVAEKYLTLARDASASGDRVMAENYLQHAEHYGRIVAAAQGSFQVQRDEREVEYDEDGEEIFEDGGQNGVAQADAPQPQMRETREGGPRENGSNGQGETYQRDHRDGQNRERGNRDGNRDFQSRENRVERDGNPARDGLNRDAQARDSQNRDPNRNREGNREQNRDFQNRENRENRGNREFNRDNRGERNREFRQNRDGGDPQGERAAQGAVPSGLGPQPFIGLPPAAPTFEAQPQPDVQAEFQPAPVPVTVDAPSPADATPRAEGEPRRRGRPRRVRSEDGEAVSAAMSAPESAMSASEPVEAAVSAPAQAPVPAPTPAPVEAPAADLGASAAVAADAPEGEVKAKRRPGRPRKKKTEDDGPEDGGDHLPAFLMASNG